MVGSDDVTSVTLTSAGAAASATVAGSPYSIVSSAAVGTGLGNYTITYANGTLTVNQKPLTITATNRSKTYGDTVTFAGTEFTAVGLVGSDGVTSVTLTSAGAAGSATVAGSPYSIVSSAAVGTGLGNYTITYANGMLTINIPAPDVTSLSPGLGKRGQNTTVVIMGTNLTGATSLSFGSGITVNSYTVNTDSRISVNITIADTATPGLRAVTVVTPGGTDTMANAFTVMPPAPTVDGVSPESGRTGDTFDVVISGSNFAGATAVNFGPGVTVNSFVVDSPTQITVRITIDQDTEPGENNIVVTTPSGDGTLTEAFGITEEPSRGSGTWWIWLLISLLAALLGLLLFLLFGRRKKKTYWEVMTRNSHS